MKRIDKMEIETPKGVSAINDADIISEVVDATMVAKYSGIRVIYGHYYIRLYRDNKLIREMDLSIYNNVIRVYNSDSKHYFPRFYDEESGGQVIISDELLEKLNQNLQKQGNSFGDATGNYN